MVAAGELCTSIAGAVFFYETPKVVQVKSIKVGVVYRTVQLIIFAYIVGWVIVYKKGYQETDVALSVVTSKVKGVAYTNDSDLSRTRQLDDAYNHRIWDPADYVIPPQENGAVFVMTNAIITTQQSQGKCAEDWNVKQGRCNVTKNTCEAGKAVPNGNGVMTGECVSDSGSNYTCEVYAWCPVEKDKLENKFKKRAMIHDVVDFTILLKNSIQFPKFGVKRRNIVDAVNNETYLQNCNYHPVSDRFCPIFKVGDLIDLADANLRNITTKGGILGITVDWDCNLDRSLEECLPTYAFSRLDEENVKISPGWNFRYANYYRNDSNSAAMRDLYKAYGILFVVAVKAKAGKFSIVPLALNIGSGLALLSLASIVCDIILLRVLRKRHYYKEQKFLKVSDEEDGQENRGIVSNMEANEKSTGNDD